MLNGTCNTSCIWTTWFSYCFCMLSFICFVWFWPYSEETCVGTYPRHSYPLGSQTKSPNFEYFLITGGFPHPPKKVYPPRNDHISQKTSPALLAEDFPSPQVKYVSSLEGKPSTIQSSHDCHLTVSRTWHCNDRTKENWGFCLQNNSIGFCLPMFRLTLLGNLLRWNQVPSSFGGLKLTQTIWRDQNKRGICYTDQKIKYLLTVWLLNKNRKATRFDRFGDFPRRQKIVKVLQSLFGVTDFPAP